jgi:hypothetical protein
MTARKRTHKKKGSTRSTSLVPYRARTKSRLAGFDPMSVLVVAAGGAAAGLINKVIPTTLDSKIVAVGKVAIGALLPMLTKEGKTKQMLSHFGEGFIAVGTYELLKGMGVISGIGQTEVADEDLLAVSLEGIEDIEFEELDELNENVLNGDDLNVVNDNVLNGDDLNVINGDLDQTY